ncbi:hypothetical protein [Ornithinimicrobium sp. INDO-MA30-4]|uniref:hypothetical protein n=1 Tax=Ornithinimicrobium sp. INDO-MA30-4 TaxID=2908651 RepID=UPI001F32FE4B|nr:hypothetical protein [Ornithinimicrobium sp. INDO-MA30-4]UJH71722.1 hypothetical protein L0A91_16690 [Ornithinimicrobium sp. INDO-MA30-4]
MSPRDERSVGEVLLEAEQLARRLLEDAPDRDGRAMARTWGESVETAADFWSAIAPQRQEAGGGIVKEQDGLLGQLAQSARGLQTAGRVSPGEGIRFDDEMTSIAENLARATELVSKYPQPLRPSRAQQADAQAARTQIVHTLYVSAHATTVALASNMRDHQEAHSGREYTDSGYGVAHLVDVQQRVAAAETMAGTWLQGRWPRDLPGCTDLQLIRNG